MGEGMRDDDQHYQPHRFSNPARLGVNLTRNYSPASAGFAMCTQLSLAQSLCCCLATWPLWQIRTPRSRGTAPHSSLWDKHSREPPELFRARLRFPTQLRSVIWNSINLFHDLCCQACMWVGGLARVCSGYGYMLW